MNAREEEIWDILVRDGIKRPGRFSHGPCIIALTKCVVIIGKQWIPACEAALEASHIRFRTMGNQIVVGDQ